MRAKRPIGVMIVAVLFVATGLVGLARYFAEGNGMFRAAELPPGVLAAIAVVAGVFLFLRSNCARWVAALWMGAHVAISAFYSPAQTAAHAVFLAVIVWLLFRRDSDAYFAHPV